MDATGGRFLWTIAAVTLLGLVVLGAVFGPRLYREGKAVVGPIMDLAKSEEVLAELNREMPFTPDPEGIVDEARLLVFLDLRDGLRPHYQRWNEVEEALGPDDQESFEDAKVALAAVREVFNAQDELLRRHRMSPAEFRWLEARVYEDWLEALEAHDSWANPALKARLETWLDEDLAVITETRRRHGASPALDRLEEHLERRRAQLEGQRPPDLEAVPDANEVLFWAHHERIEAVDFRRDAELHARLLEDPGNFQVQVGDEGVGEDS